MNPGEGLKGLQMPEIHRTSCIIGTAGHIDHGKTTLVKALTGIDTDRLAEEKRRGVSIDLGFAYMDLDLEGKKTRAALIDVPGHEKFIRNMLAGTSGIDFVLFVVAADDGIMPQTREHLDIVHLLGIKKGIFVITKTDLVADVRAAEVKKEIELLIRDTALEGSPIVNVSYATGEGIEGLKGLIKDNIMALGGARVAGFFRLPVDRSFTVKGFGTVVTGTVASGSIKKGGEAVHFPNGRALRIRGIQSLYLNAETVFAGERAALNLSGVNHNEIGRGAVVMSKELMPFAEAAKKNKVFTIDCAFEFLKSAGSATVLKNRALVKVHHLTDETLAIIQFHDRKDIRGGEKVYGRLLLKKPVLMLKGDRFVLRDPSVNATIGGGIVSLPYLSNELVPRISKIRPLKDNSPEEALRSLLCDKVALDTSVLSMMLNLPESEFQALAARLKGDYKPLGIFTADIKNLGSLKKKLTDIIAAYHSSSPMEAGINEDELFRKVRQVFAAGLVKKESGLILKEAIEELSKEGLIRRDGVSIALNAHRPGSAGKDAKIEEAIMAFFKKGFIPPLLEELEGLAFPKADISRVMAYLQRRGEIVKLKEGSFMSGEALKISREKLAGHIDTKGGIKAAEFRDLLGCGRKLAIEILEYFDKERVTLRQGDVRILRK